MADAALESSPSNFGLVEFKAMSYLAQGDLESARGTLKAAQQHIEPAALIANVAQYNDLVWLLTANEREKLLALPPSAFNENRAYWAYALSQACALKGDRTCLRRYADIARLELSRQLVERPRDSQNVGALGVSLAYLGRKDEAMMQAERGLKMGSFFGRAPDPHVHYYAAQTYTLVGEQDKAMQQLQLLVTMLGYITPAWLRIDPNFDPLRKNPRFQKLVAGAK